MKNFEQKIIISAGKNIYCMLAFFAFALVKQFVKEFKLFWDTMLVPFLFLSTWFLLEGLQPSWILRQKLLWWCMTKFFNASCELVSENFIRASLTEVAVGFRQFFFYWRGFPVYILHLHPENIIIFFCFRLPVLQFFTHFYKWLHLLAEIVQVWIVFGMQPDWLGTAPCPDEGLYASRKPGRCQVFEVPGGTMVHICLLYTSDAADE